MALNCLRFQILIVFFSVSSVVIAATWDVPEPTDFANRTAVSSSVPPEVTPKPGYGSLQVRAPAAASYCGWASGNISQAVSCASTQYCALNEGSYVACCDSTYTSCGYSSTCYPSSVYDILGSSGSKDLYCTESFSTTTVEFTSTRAGWRGTGTYSSFWTTYTYTRTKSQCAEYRFDLGTKTATAWSCDTSGQTISVETYLSSEGISVFLSNRGPTTASMSSSSSNRLSTSTSTTYTPSISSLSNASMDGGKIAGLVIGVVVGLALLLLVAWYCIKNNRKKTRTEYGTVSPTDKIEHGSSRLSGRSSDIALSSDLQHHATSELSSPLLEAQDQPSTLPSPALFQISRKQVPAQSRLNRQPSSASEETYAPLSASSDIQRQAFTRPPLFVKDQKPSH